MDRRLLVVAVLVVFAGCGSNGSADPTATVTPAPVPSINDVAEPDWPPPQSDSPIKIRNNDETTRQFSIVVTRGSAGVVYDGDHRIPPDSNRAVYNLQEADPAGVESFAIEVTMGNQTESVVVRTDACHGTAFVQATATGELVVNYVIC